MEFFYVIVVIELLKFVLWLFCLLYFFFFFYFRCKALNSGCHSFRPYLCIGSQLQNALIVSWV